MINNNDNRLKCRHELENAIKANDWIEREIPSIINDENQILSI